MTDVIHSRESWSARIEGSESANLDAQVPVGREANLPRYTRMQGTIYDWDTIASRILFTVARQRGDTLSFFRHGETKYNRKKLVSGQHDTVLSARGRAEASSLANKLQGPVSLLACSALTRAIETMELSIPANVRSTVPVVIDHRLNEVNLGILQGRKAEFIQQFADGDLNWAPSGGESYKEAARRVFSAVVDLFDQLAEIGTAPQSGAVFCHAGVMRIIGTLIDEHSESRNVFNNSAKNLECLAVSAVRLSLPAFWREDDKDRAGKRNFKTDSGRRG